MRLSRPAGLLGHRSMTTAHLRYDQLAPKPFRALLGLSETVHASSLGARLVDLVLLRVSQINGCAFCMDMHWRDLVAKGEQARVLNTVAGWRESPFFDARDRAALLFAERMSRIPQGEPDPRWIAEAQAELSDVEVAELGFVVGVIQVWNRLNVMFGMPVPEGV